MLNVLKGRGLCFDAVAARLDLRKGEASIRVRLDDPTKGRLHIDNRNGGAANRAATRIDDLAAKTAGGLALRGNKEAEARAPCAEGDEERDPEP